MAIGLSRALNLSEINLNLKESLQKLYAPGIENDIELFSLSSQLTSSVLSGPEGDDIAKLIGLRSEAIREANGDVIRRTRFLTQGNTWSNNDEVFFDNFAVTPSAQPDAVNPISRINNGIASVRVLYGGSGYYFKEVAPAGVTIPKNFVADELVIKNVVLEGSISKSNNARAQVTFAIEPDTVFPSSDIVSWQERNSQVSVAAGVAGTVSGTTNNLTINANGTWNYFSPDQIELSTDLYVTVLYSNGETKEYLVTTRLFTSQNSSGVLPLAPIGSEEDIGPLATWTGFYTRRYSVAKIEILEQGTGYLVGERINIVTETNVEETSSSQECVIVRQIGERFFSKDPRIVNDNFKYSVRGSNQDGFYLFDNLSQKFIFIDTEIPVGSFNSDTPREIKLVRDDSIFIDNILQLKFAQSNIYISNYIDPFIPGESLSGDLLEATSKASELRSDSFRAIQNTKNPEEVSSDANTLGFRFNRILGQDAAINQRVVIRDQDFLLGTFGVTGLKLKNNVRVPKFRLDDPDIRVPGLFIKVGPDYKRAFSTQDKPFFQLNSLQSGNINPDVVGGFTYGEYAVFAANLYAEGWKGYNVNLSSFAQRISVPDGSDLTNAGENGALFYHKNSKEDLPVTAKTSGSKSYYEVSLFTFLPGI